MFVHGREAYRRNALLILYNFYKNVLYISTQYFFGSLSAFSGQVLYEPFIYQLYNVTFTSFPIIYYCLFDFEYEKVFFMKNPMLYKLGLESQSYGIQMFWKWVIYALVQALLIYFICFNAILTPGQTLQDGRDIGLHVAGHNVYTICIIISNTVLMHKFNNYTGWGELLVAIMIMNIFTILFIESLMSMFPQVYLIFVPLFSQPVIWASLVFVIIMVSVFEFAFSSYQSLVADAKVTVDKIKQSNYGEQLNEVEMQNRAAVN